MKITWNNTLADDFSVSSLMYFLLDPLLGIFTQLKPCSAMHLLSYYGLFT